MGMMRIEVKFRGVAGHCFGGPHFDPPSLRAEASRAGWKFEILLQNDSG
jgi:hypothetical protein